MTWIFLGCAILTLSPSETTRRNVCVSALSNAKSRVFSPRTSTFVKTLSTSKHSSRNLARKSTTLPSCLSRTSSRRSYSSLEPSSRNLARSKTATPLLSNPNFPIPRHGVLTSLSLFCLARSRGWMASPRRCALLVALCSMFTPLLKLFSRELTIAGPVAPI